MPEPSFIRMKEAAKRLSVSTRTIRRMEQRKLLPTAIRMGRWYTAMINGQPRAQYRGLTLYDLSEFNLALKRLKLRTRFPKPKQPAPPAEEPDATDRPDAPQG